MEKVCKTQQEEEIKVHLDQYHKEHFWLIDSGCTNHMTYDQGLFRELDKTTVSKVRIGNGEYISAKGKETVAIESLSGLKLIPDVLFVPNIDQNLLSVGQLLEKGFKMRGKSFALNLLEEEQATVSQENNVTTLWHKRLGHFHHNGVLYMKKNQLAVGLPDLKQNLPTCIACQYGKQSKLPFAQKSTWRSSHKLQLVHTDVGGPQRTPSLKGRFNEAVENKKWRVAMQEELSMIEKNNTWELVDRPTHKKAIGVKWVILKCSCKFFKTFAPVAELVTIRMLLALAAQKGWKIYQLDVKSTFLNGYLEEEIFVEQPEGFAVKGKEDKVYQLKKALYGLKQAPKLGIAGLMHICLVWGLKEVRVNPHFILEKLMLTYLLFHYTLMICL
ncbi:hypothetical protein AAG906_016093 [Vitis piasezkii]